MGKFISKKYLGPAHCTTLTPS